MIWINKIYFLFKFISTTSFLSGQRISKFSEQKHRGNKHSCANSGFPLKCLPERRLPCWRRIGCPSHLQKLGKCFKIPSVHPRLFRTLQGVNIQEKMERKRPFGEALGDSMGNFSVGMWLFLSKINQTWLILVWGLGQFSKGSHLAPNDWLQKLFSTWKGAFFYTSKAKKRAVVDFKLYFYYCCIGTLAIFLRVLSKIIFSV